MSGQSHKTATVTIRLPNDVIETIKRRAAKGHWTSPNHYLQQRIIYDTRRKHKGLTN